MSQAQPSTRTLTFGSFRLLAAERGLFEGARPVRLGSRALLILIALLERAGELVTKEELLSRGWPDSSVDAGNLRVNIAALRKALRDGEAGAQYIENVPGRGYRFVAAVGSDEAPPPGPAPGLGCELARQRELPAPLLRMVGRADTVQELTMLLQHERLVTVVAPGGMGKTTVALAVVESLAQSYEHRARFVDLASLADPSLVPNALAFALGLPSAAEGNIKEILAFLADKRLLLLLDSCEHVAAAACAIAERVLEVAPLVHVLATSRQPLRAAGERVSLLPPLEMPPRSSTPSAAHALTFSAVTLFVERARVGEFEVPDADVPIVAEICRRLEGNPLAIELAASRVAVFGVRGLATRLDGRFSLLMKGRRSAPPRHRTLHAMLDWSFGTLSQSEATVLQRLSVFRASFTFESAVAVSWEASLPESEVEQSIASLTAKCLLVADASGEKARYRLPEITREYAAGTLTSGGERQRIARRHAEHHRDLFERAEALIGAQLTDEWLGSHSWRLDDVRASLDWAFAPGGDLSVGVSLAVSSMLIWFHACLLDEYRVHVERALERVRAASPPDPVRELQLSAALGQLLLHTVGPTSDVTRLAQRALDLSSGLEAPLRMHATGAAWVAAMGRADYRGALQLAKAYRLLRRETVVESADSARMTALPLHFLGRHRAARRQLARVVEPDKRLGSDGALRVEREVLMQTVLARLSWLEGRPEEALAAIGECVARAVSLNHATSLCFAIALGACPIALWCGETEAARRWTEILTADATRHSFGYWISWARAFEWVLALCDDAAQGAPPRRAPRKLAFGAMQAEMLGTLNEELLDAETIVRGEGGDIGWCAAEIARARGALLLKQGVRSEDEAAESLFLGSVRLARRQGALAWELRSASSLAELWLSRSRPREARELLEPIFGRFKQGFRTKDLRRAYALLSELGG